MGLMMLMRARASGVPVIAQSSTLIDKYTGTNTATIGTHQIGDYFVAYASRDGSSTAPTVPGGWTTISSGGANALGYALAWKIAASTSETAGTFTNATSLIIVHERTSSGWTPTIGAFANNASGSGVSPAIPALTLQNTDNTSRVIAFYASVAADITGLTTPPSGMEYIGQTQDATDTSSAYRTTSTVSSWSSAATSFSGTTGAVRATAVEIKLTYSTGAAPEAPSSLVATAVSSTQINLTWVDNSNTETGFVVERSADGSTGWSVITTTAANATSYGDTGLTAETAYYYRVKSTNGYGDSSYTSVANDTTDVASTTYSDSFESGDLNGPGAPFAWDNGKGGHGVISTTRAYTGTYSVKVPQYADGGQMPFDLGAEYRCVRVTYRFWLPSNYQAVNTGWNNKLIRLWPGGGANNGEESYGFLGKVGASLWMSSSTDGDMQIDITAEGGGIGPVDGVATDYFTAAMRGAWHQASWLFRGATTMGGSDGTAEAWLNGSSVLSLTGLPSNAPSTLQKFRYGYLFGWANSGIVANPTDIYIDDVSFECGENL